MSGCSVGMQTTVEPTSGTTSVQVGMRGPAAAAARDTGTAATPPEVGPPPRLEMPDVADYRLDNGLRVLLVERHDLPVVSLQVQFAGGASAHPPAQAGLAAFTADMIDEGTRKRSALEIADELEYLGATLTSTAGYDASNVRLSVLRPRLEPALELLADVVVRPTFPPDEMERVRARRTARIRQRRREPAALADDAFSQALYGATHPYGVPLVGTESSLASLTRDDVESFHHARYRPGQATLVVVGDVTRDDLDRLLESAFAGWEGHGEDPPALPPPAPTRESRIILVHRAGSQQSEMRIGRVSLARSTPEYAVASVTNTLLGGSFTSRLNSLLREEKGYTYGAYSYFDFRRGAGPFQAGAAVATAVTDSAVADVMSELGRLAAEEASEAELERARNYLALRLPQRFETADDVVARLSELALYGIDPAFWEEYVPAVLAVDADDVRDFARRRLDPGGMVVVVAGDREVVEEPLRRLGLGPVDVR